MEIKGIFVIKGNIPDNVESICNNAQFIVITEMPVYVHLLNDWIGGSMERYGTVGSFIRGEGIIRAIRFFESFELLFNDTIGIPVRSNQQEGRTWVVSPIRNPV